MGSTCSRRMHRALRASLLAILSTSSALAQNNYFWATPESGLWSDSQKWAPNTGRPGNDPLDNVTISAVGRSYVVTLDTDALIRDFTLSGSDAHLYIPESTLTVTGNSALSGGTLSLGGGQFIQNGGTLAYGNCTVQGGPIVLNGAQLLLNSTKAVSFLMHGNCQMSSSSIRNGQQISLVAAGEAATLSLPASNAGILTLDSTTADDVTLSRSSTFTNQGTFNIQPGAGGARTIACNLVNSGTVNLNAATTFSNSSISNSGELRIAPGVSLEMNTRGKDFFQTGGVLDVRGHLTVTNSAFRYLGGSITGNPVELNSSELSLGTNVAPTSFMLHGDCTSSYISSGVQVSLLAAGQAASLSNLNTNYGTLDLDSNSANDVSVTSASGVTNRGIVNVQAGAGGGRTFGNNFTNDTGATLNLNTTTRFNGLSNSGTINIRSGASLELATSQMFSQAAGTLNLEGGLKLTNGMFSYAGGTIVGGPIELTSSSLFLGSTAPAWFIARGSCTMGTKSLANGQGIAVVAAGQTASLSGLTTNNGIVNLDSSTANDVTLITSSTLTNNGTINVQPGAGGARTVTGDFTNSPTGTLNLNASLSFNTLSAKITNSGVFDIAQDVSMDIQSGNPQFLQNGGTLNVGGHLRMANGSFTYNGGVISGEPIELKNSSLYLGSTGPAVFVTHGMCNVSSTINAGQTVVVVADGQPAMLSKLAQNKGTLALVSTSADDVMVVVPISSTLHNSGTIYVEPGAGGHRIIQGSLINDIGGTLNIDTATTFSLAPGITNQGTINISSGASIGLESGSSITNQGSFNIARDASVDLTAPSQKFTQKSGTLDIQGHLGITQGTFTFSGGTITGQPVELNDAGLTITSASTGPAGFVMRGSCSMTSPLYQGQWVSVVADGRAASLTHVAMTNDGTINIDSASGHDVTLQSNGSAPLTNNGTILIRPGAGGRRIITTDLVNNSGGTMNIDAPTSFTQNNGSVVNSGTFNISAGAAFDLNGGSQRFEQVSGTLDVRGGLSITDGAFDYDGGTITGEPIDLTRSWLNLNTAASGIFRLHDVCSLSLTSQQIASGQVIAIVADKRPASLTTPPGTFTNAGMLSLDSMTRHDTTLNLSTFLVNTGFLVTEPGAGGTRIIAGDFMNAPNATAILNANTRFSRFGGQLNNQGIINIASTASVDLTVGSQTFTQAAGNLNVWGQLNLTNGTFVYTGGNIVGNPVTLNSSRLDLRSTGPASFTLHGYCSLQGATGYGIIGPGQEVSAVASGMSCSVFGVVENHGTLNMDSTIIGGVSLTAPVSFSNFGVLNVLAGAGGPRDISGFFANKAYGIVNLSTPTWFHGSGITVNNFGNWNLLTPGAVAVNYQNTFNNNGKLSGVGKIDVTTGTFNNNAVVAPGFSAGVLTVLGDYHQTQTGLLEMELGGLAAGSQYDQLTITGRAFLDGGLQITLIDGFAPALGDSFRILSFSDTQGTRFSWMNMPNLGSELSWDVSQLYTSGTITVTPEPASALLGLVMLTLGARTRRARRRFTHL